MTTMRMPPIPRNPKATVAPSSHYDETNCRNSGNGTNHMLAEISRTSRNRRNAVLGLQLGADTTSTAASMTPTTATPPRLSSRPKLSSSSLKTAFLITSFLVQPISAVLIPFSNCLPDNYVNPDPGSILQLQWAPLFVDAVFDTEDSTHNLKITVWGNVTGRIGTAALPLPGDPRWSDPDDVLWGKIRDQPEPDLPDGTRKATTLHRKLDVVTYTPYSLNSNFCDNLLNQSCPLGPVFNNTP